MAYIYRKKSQQKAPVTRKTLLKRIVLILALFILAGSVSYPAGANTLIDGWNRITSLSIPHVEYPLVLGLDLQGGSHLEYVADLSNVPLDQRGDAMDGARDVIERRVNQMGVSEPLVQTAKAGDQWRLTVELAGIRDVNQAINMIGETPILEFRIQNEQANRGLTEEEQQMLLEANKAKRELAEEIFKRAQAGDPIQSLSEEYSDDETIRAAGGDLGWVLDQRQYIKLKELGQDLNPGDAYPMMVDDGQNFYIAQVEEKKDAGQEIRASHLLIQWEGGEQSAQSRTKELALELMEKIKSEVTPANFEEKVMEYSDEPGADKTAGDLDYFRRGDMVPPFEDAAFALTKGAVSDVVETQFGFHLIKKTDERNVSDLRVRAVVLRQMTAADILNTEPWVRTELTGKQLKRAVLDFDPQTGAPIVVLDFDSEGTALFAKMTKDNIGKPIAIYLDGSPISIPTVQTEITGGQAVISGSFTVNEAKLLAQRLQAGALPVPIELIAQQTVGPTLGSESIALSLKAGLIGFLLVLIFMILFYRIPGIISVFALAFYVAVVLAIFKIIPVTMTLSGIAGFILSIGMAVDANVLIFERLKEEFRTDKPLQVSVDEAFKRAWSSIRDGNVTTLLVCLVLYTFTSSLVKGFALTLGIGILVSMFTAIVITRTILKLFVSTPLSRALPWFFLHPRNKAS
ncbi:protein translocase subunit SecD [Patescibacteria group bacterium]|nr:protein translocase subunit SecD [Patescibacteria group bacterium]MDL1952611.1 protein translocase subunit SecD [Candidatus Uhrbacteria bacterium UHB]RIL01257.1 MAG: protein translocase subunit SecD [Candidatus Uhrbacteria bacterium]